MSAIHLLPGLLDITKSEASISWEPFYEGVDIHWIYRDGEHGPAAALIRFEPGARVPHHHHIGYEHILVLRGSQTDRNGHLTAGTLMINPPETSHDIVSEEGCIVLAIYEKRISFGHSNAELETDQSHTGAITTDR